MSYTRDEILLDIKHVTKRYGAKEVLSDVCVQIKDLHCSDASRTVGQVIAILGPSGCGKSTLLRIMAGLEAATSGSVLLNSAQLPVHCGQVGMVFQRYPVWSHRKVLGNLVVAGEMAGMSRSEATAKAREYLDLFGLSSDGDKYPAELSGGMQQRVAIARQLIGTNGPVAHPTRLLLLDEPFSALDLNNIKTVCSMIRNVADMHDDNTLVIVTHDLRAAIGVADMLWIMGRDRDATGQPCSGGKIVREIDLAEMGLTWNAAIYEMAEFVALEAEISRMYKTL